jgi:hypothetical protein
MLNPTNYVYYGFVVKKSDPEYSALFEHYDGKVFSDLNILQTNISEYVLIGLKLSEISEEDDEHHNLIISDDLEKSK